MKSSAHSYGPHLGMLEGMGMERKDLAKSVPLHVLLPNYPPWQEQQSWRTGPLFYQRPSTERQQKEFCEV